MTEQQHEEELLSELLDLPEPTVQQRTSAAIPDQTLLSRPEEQALLRAANEVGTPTLAPEAVEREHEHAPHSFVSDLAGVARKYPVLTMLAAGGVAFLLARRRR